MTRRLRPPARGFAPALRAVCLASVPRLGSLQRLIVEARKELGLPYATVHTLRQSFATHLVEAGISLHVLQALPGHRHINTTMLYLHLTHRSEQDCRKLIEDLGCGLI